MPVGSLSTVIVDRKELEHLERNVDFCFVGILYASERQSSVYFHDSTTKIRKISPVSHLEENSFRCQMTPFLSKNKCSVL